MSALEEARPQEGQKRASSADMAPQLEQLLIPWIVLPPSSGQISNRLAVVEAFRLSLSGANPRTRVKMENTPAPASKSIAESESMKRIRLVAAILPALLLATTLALAADWHTGKLMDTEKQEVPTGSTTQYNTDAQAKNGKYTQNTTAHTSQDTDTYQVFTIQTPTKTYVVREKLNFPWSKPANIALGENVKFMVQGNKMTILDDDQKQHKASVVKASLTQSN
jgi:hypothetical protein